MAVVNRGDLVAIKSRWTQQILTFRVTRVNEGGISGRSNQSYTWVQHELLWVNGQTIQDDPKLMEAICLKAEGTGKHKWQS
jgi:hypothetical protein